MLAVEVEVEVFEWTEASHSEPELRWQPGSCGQIDQELGAIRKRPGREAGAIVFRRSLANFDLADFAAAAASMNLIRDDADAS